MKTPTVGILLLLSFYQIDARAQITVSVNPANKQDARVLLTNPAAAAVTASRVYLGYKLIYPGVVPNNAFALKASFFTLSLPRVGQEGFATGVHGRYFNTPLFQEGDLARASRVMSLSALPSDLILDCSLKVTPKTILIWSTLTIRFFGMAA